MSRLELRLQWIEGNYAIARLDAGTRIPDWAQPDQSAPLISITSTGSELSIVAPVALVPQDIRAERGWIAMAVVGTLDFALTGVLSSLTGALADASVSVFAVSTFDTDVLLVKEHDRVSAVEALSKVADTSGLTT